LKTISLEYNIYANFCFQECILEQRTLGSGRNATGARSSSARISWRGWHPRRPGLKY